MTIFQAPPRMTNSKLNFDMNAFTLQMNQCSDELFSKISPTDSRRRKDILFWENNDLTSTEAGKERLEKMQGDRLKDLISHSNSKNSKEAQDLHVPYFFEKSENDEYTLIENKYWKMREEKCWDGIPDLYGDQEFKLY